MENKIIQSDKAIMRAIAATYVNNKKKVTTLVNKYVETDKNISKDKMLTVVLMQLSGNRKFAEDFTKLMVKKGNLKNASGTRNGEGGGFTIGDPITTIISSVSNVASSLIDSRTTKLQGQNMATQQQADAEAQMMSLIANAENKKSAKEKQVTLVMAISLVAVFGIIGIVLYNKTKKK